MADDEASLQASLDQYNAQLSQIRELLKASDDLTKLELYDLEKDLMELIKIAEGSMLDLRKKKLLALYDATTTCTDSYQTGSCNSQVLDEKEIPSELEDDPSDVQSDLVGVKCRVRYTHEWGGFQYHNAIILNCDIDDCDDAEPRVKVHVLFLNPVHTSMVPCKYFLDDKCDYEATCRYSHGYVVDMDELEEYVEPDFTQLQKRCKCLAKYENDGVWYPATVDDVHEEQVTVSFDQYDESLTLDFHSILPLPSNTDDSSDDDSHGEDVDEVGESKVTSISMHGPMCDWEKYTKGIGSKLLQKMGYILGKGLGKDGRGIIEPVEIRLLPPGKSLDHIAELREKGKIKDPTKTKGKRNAGNSEVVKETAFDVINKLLHTTSKETKSNHSGSSSKHSVEDSYKSIKKHLKTKRSGDVRTTQKNKDSKINLERFKTGEELATLKKQLHMQKQALSRNSGDTSVSRRIKQNIEETESKIQAAEKKDQSLQTKLHMKNQSKKLSVF